MKLLLDTHVLLWILQDSKALTPKARLIIRDAEAVYVSSVSMWEVSIKLPLGKLAVDMERFDAAMQASPFMVLPVTWAHAKAVHQLPLLHRDPFDRMLVAQAVSEPMHLITHDARLAAYSPLVTVV